MPLIFAASYTPEQTSTFFLAIFFLSCLVGLTAIAIAGWRLFAPKIAARYDAQTAKHDADAKLSASLAVSIPLQVETANKTNQLLEGQGQDIRGVKETLLHHGRQIVAISKHLKVEQLIPHEANVVFQPGVERSPTGTDRPVILKTEVLHPPEESERR